MSIYSANPISNLGNTPLIKQFGNPINGALGSGVVGESSLDYSSNTSFLDYMTVQNVMSMDGSLSTNENNTFDITSILQNDPTSWVGGVTSALKKSLTDTQLEKLKSSYDMTNLTTTDVNNIMLDLANMGVISTNTATDFAGISSLFSTVSGLSPTSSYNQPLQGTVDEVVQLINTRMTESQNALYSNFNVGNYGTNSYDSLFGTSTSNSFDSLLGLNINNTSLFGSTNQQSAHSTSLTNYLTVIDTLSQLL